MDSKEIKFGTDGIRGKAGNWPINSQGAQKIAVGVGNYLVSKFGEGNIVVASDTRNSSDMLMASMIAGVLSTGVNVYDAEILPTAGVAFLTKFLNSNLGIMISASHNPWDQNGIKILGPGGHKLSDDMQEEVEKYINMEHEAKDVSNYGKIYRNREMLDKFGETFEDLYVNFLIKPFLGCDSWQDFSIVVDCANGAASYVAPKAFQKLGINIFATNTTPNGININLNAGSEVLRDGTSNLPYLIRNSNADFGLAFDGDADRAIFIDKEGVLIDGDHILYLLAKYLVSKGELNVKSIVTTEMANSGLDSALKKLAISTLRTKVGDRFVFEAMQRYGIKIGGEQSGHIIIYDDDHVTGDGIYTALYVVKVISESYANNGLVALSQELKKYPQIISSAFVETKVPLEDIPNLNETIMELKSTLGTNVNINMRYSGTEPLFRIMIEGEADHTVEQITECAVIISRSVQEANGVTEGHIEVKDCTTGKEINLKV